MRAEILAIGDELITGQRLDTNTQWLAERLTELGVEVAFHTTIGDRLADNVAAFRAAIERADVVVITGGLGPTADDLTREALAAAAGVGLARDEASLAHIRKLFASRGREMPERNVVQADFPIGATPIANEHGTAPGIQMRVGSARIFALPGVPAEMKPMWFATVAPAIAADGAGLRPIRHRRLKCFGVGESALEAMLPDLIRRDRDPIVGITVSDATITLRITAAAADEAAWHVAVAPTEQIIRDALGTLVFGEEEEELENAVVRLLRQQQKTLAVAEWATGGLVEELVAIAGDDVLNAGVTVTNSAAAERLLGVATTSPDSSAWASATAEAVRERTGADVGLGIAAFPAEVDAPDAHVYVSIATAERTRRLRFGCASHPAIRRARTAKQALNAVRLTLLGEGADEA